VTSTAYVPCAFRRCRGFTLVEVLVVVLLIAIAVSFVTVNLGTDDREILRGEAVRLAAGLQQARDEAVVTRSAIAWRGGAGGYEYLRRDAERGWVPLDVNGAFPPRFLEFPVRLAEVEVEGVRVAPGSLVVLSPSVLAPVRIVLEANGERAIVEVGATARVVTRNGV
jgi:general secretion pathway protein H